MHGAFPGRKEDQRLLTGKGQFTGDWNLPGQLYAVFLRSDHAHAEITNLDVSAARAMPGVIDVITSADIRGANLGKLPQYGVFKGRNGTTLINPPRDLLAHGKVFYVGQPIAAVIAESVYEAQDAVEQIVVDYKDLGVVVDVHSATAPGAPQLYPEIPNNLAYESEIGDEAVIEKIFAEAPHVVDVTVNNTRVIINPMEPASFLASWDEAKQRFDLYRPHQGINTAMSFVLGYFGPPVEKYRMITKDVGGSFGARAITYPEHVAIMIATQRLKRPIKWVSTRSETIVSDYHGRSVVTNGKLAFDNDGKFLGVRYFWQTNVGGYPLDIGSIGHTRNSMVACTGPYKIANVYGRYQIIVTNTVPLGAYRGAGRPETAMMIEQMVDEAARKLNMDPIEIRRRNAITRDQFPYTTPMGIEYDSGDHPGLLAIAQEKSDWKNFPARRKEAAARGKVRGIGVSCYIEGAGGAYPQPEQTRIRFLDNGKVIIDTIAGPSGQGLETTLALVVSRELGIPYDDITVSHSDPDGPRMTGMGSGGSRAAMIYGSALTHGSREIIKKGLDLAAEDLEAAAQDIEFKDGVYQVKGTDLKIKLVDVARNHMGALDTLGVVDAMTTFPGGVHVVEIELDPETGEIAIVQYLGVDDCGNLIDHTMAEGQLLGGIVQGVGQALGEFAHYDSDGQLLTGSFMDYYMPRADMMGHIELVDHPIPTPRNILGAKGVAESGCTGGLSTTYSAILDALLQVGVTGLDMPFTPGRVWQAIHEAKQK